MSKRNVKQIFKILRDKAFKGLVEQKNVVFNSFVCKLGFFWHERASLKRELNEPLMPKKKQFTHELLL
jgi:hypothetical protein